MENLALMLNLLLVAVAAVLFGLGGASFYAMLKGSLALRRGLRSAGQGFRSVLLKSPIVPGVSVIYTTTGYSRETRAIVRRLLDLHFATSELVLVLDGLSEANRARWVEELHLVPREHSSQAKTRGFYISQDPLRLLVVDQEAGGEAEALNAGVHAARYPVLGLVDGEADFIPEFMLFLIQPMLQDWEGTAGVCGVSAAPGGPTLAGRIGSIEALRLWLVRGAAFSAWNRVVPVPGCCMLVKRAAVLSAGGFRGGPLELFLDLHASTPACRIAFVPAPVSFRPPANSWGELRRQVMRDQRLLTAALRRQGAGRKFLGLFGMRVVRPLLETAGLLLAAVGLITGAVQPALAALVLLASAGSGIAVSMAAVVLRELVQPGAMPPRSLAALFFASVPENLGYRQVRNLWLTGALFQRESRATGPGPRARDVAA